ncbi:hypothetical protein HG535_0H02320 [Zygotorulaspora mrakii]|uniref:Uncharacterized protein n=1 Tax=Zygotorulaspora mrakii TaxID=42260 RepID=A0A7H9B8A0_ZYGMR|nr:uncharacterized protein HG535_0H02320 [Zygotorulaspora mrakii]QLG74905.1 hypothetical protein HG535_0H02320 [Zygotorulaspora mrakii]
MPLKYHDETLKNTYKHLKLYPKLASLKHGKRSFRDKQYAVINESFKPCVSFNTVPSYMDDGAEDDGLDFPGVQFPAEYTMEEYYDDESGYMSDNSEYYLRNNYVTDGRSRGMSPPPSSYRSKKQMLSSMFKIAENGKIVRVDYPSKPTILNDAIIINRAQPGWKKLWVERRNKINERVENKTEYFKYPDIMFPRQPALKTSFISEDGYTPVSKVQRRKEKILHKKVGNPNTPRTILCHISGRRHTWVALDWTIREFARDTDHIVVLANLPKYSTDKSRGRRSSATCTGSQNFKSDDMPRSISLDARSAQMSKKMNPYVEWTSGYQRDSIVEKLLNILSYIALIIPKRITIKVTVEIVIGKTEKIMVDAVNVYSPDICVSATLKWERTENLVVWKSNKLTDTLCTKFPVPVFVAPVKRMWEVETSLEKCFQPIIIGGSESASDSSPEETSATGQYSVLDNSETPSVISLTSNSGNLDSYTESDVSDSEGGSSIVSLKERLVLFSKKHRQDLTKSLREIDNAAHDTHLQKQSKSLNFIIESSLNFSSGIERISKNYSGQDETGLDRLKRVITGGTEIVSNHKKSMLDVDDVPKKSSDRKISSTKPRKGAIKFAPTVNPKDGNRALGKSKMKQPESGRESFIKRDLSPLRQSTSITVASGSGETQNTNSNSIRKVRSSNSLYSTKSNDSVVSNGSAKKKSGGFLSIFRSGRSRSTSRRNSSGSESDRASMGSDSSRKTRSRLFGFS